MIPGPVEEDVSGLLEELQPQAGVPVYRAAFCAAWMYRSTSSLCRSA